jgi:hypothetical protein
MKQKQSCEDHGDDGLLLQKYEQFLTSIAQWTIESYVRTTHQVMGWVAQRPGNVGYFHPRQLTKTVVELYLASLEQEGFSLNRRALEIDLSSCAQRLMEEK